MYAEEKRLAKYPELPPEVCPVCGKAARRNDNDCPKCGASPDGTEPPATFYAVDSEIEEK